MRNDTYEPELKPCPSCGNSHEVYCNEDGHYVHCGGCGLSTGDYDSPEEACTAWNRRTPPASAQSDAPVGFVDGAGFPALFGHKPLNPGTKLYTTPPSAEGARDAVLAEVMAMIVNKCGLGNTMVASVFDMIGEMQSKKEA